MRRILQLCFILLTTSMFAQERYLSKVFSDVTRNTVLYGKNYTVILVPSVGHTVGQPLAADVYTPTGDTETKRPLVLYFHTGNFLPYPQNTSPSGTFRDSTAVDIVRKFAQMGYVSASVDYRLGWNPIASTQEGRVSTLINAAYRGVQDARTAIRYFKANADLFGIDTNKIMLFGQGTGGYITLATASLDKYSEVISTTAGPGKFISPSGLPYVIEKIPFPPSPTGVLYIAGDIEGKNLGLVPPNADGTPNPGPPPTGDTLCFPNHINNTSDFAFCVNMGGALGDISWLDAITPPIVCIQAPYDPFAPYDDAVLNVPIPGGALPVVRVQGSLAVQRRMEELGKNDPFKAIVSNDPVGEAIKFKQDGLVNLFPIIGTNVPNDSSPWDFWDPATNPNSNNGLATNPDMSAEKGRRYIDSVMVFVAPRACVALDLPCKTTVTTVSTKDLTDAEVGLSLTPNPASNNVELSVSGKFNIQSVQLFDISGKKFAENNAVNSKNFTLTRGQLKNGIYIVQIGFENGVITKKVIFE